MSAASLVLILLAVAIFVDSYGGAEDVGIGGT
ncbi:hypothetical protein A2U01_0119265, partial [Trifolium medium]|nr:hypothetical protein [Trifolium medium]